ncbi:MAG: flagellar biosynthesis protein FlhF [bacterium]|nr:flagellar biosynthesis protein FlhF [bacterium]
MMKYKTYEAVTLQQAILKMTIDLGKDALLVSHKNIRKGGILGLFGKKLVEVTAAVPMKSAPTPTILPKTSQTRPESPHPAPPSSPPQRVIYSNPTLTSPQPYGYPAPPKSIPLPGAPVPGALATKESLFSAEATTSVHKELQEIKTRMESMLGEITGKTPTYKYPGKSGELYIRLLQNEVDEKLSENLIKKVITESPGGLLDKEDYLEERLKAHITGMIKISGPIQLIENSPKMICLVGPTGIGKTTTLAKLAADFAFEKRKKVAIITVDTYRIAAVEQLKAYSEILNLPLEVVFAPSEFKGAIEKYVDYDVILIDTAGRSQKNSMQLVELKSFIDTAGYRLEIYLLLSATTKDKELIDIVESFKKVSFHKLIFTKLDETVTFGPILNLITQIPQGISYVTTGQNVPEDIEEANAGKLAKLIIGVN